ncbi:hypothetical protein E2C01_043300 [Portunus trituberculatus]|uniref:Uncharacterized protein n=1 Tax=Portunus trituberculatus TaxID=210409 RepID=A0A5B7FVR3_PORTR|nr:hypothetical protein [Portunus trituberculatus]
MGGSLCRVAADLVVVIYCLIRPKSGGSFSRFLSKQRSVRGRYPDIERVIWTSRCVACPAFWILDGGKKGCVRRRQPFPVPAMAALKPGPAAAATADAAAVAATSATTAAAGSCADPTDRQRTAARCGGGSWLEKAPAQPPLVGASQSAQRLGIGRYGRGSDSVPVRALIQISPWVAPN